MNVFIIQKNLDGILQSLYYSYINNVLPDKILDEKMYQPFIGAVTIEISPIDCELSRVKNALIKYSGKSILNQTEICLKAQDENALKIAFDYCYQTLKYRSDISGCLSFDAVSEFFITVRKVLNERHRALGFLRFSVTKNGIMYAPFSPDNDIIDMVSPHFYQRLNKTPFVIHDLKRNKVAISNGEQVFYTQTTCKAELTLSENEEAFLSLWKKYFSAVNIVERKNLRCQANFLPKKYRPFMPETYETN